MTRERVAGVVVGMVFGATLSWTGMIDPNVIRSALLFEDSYLYLMFASAVATAFVGQRLLRGRRALLTDKPIEWNDERPQRRHITGALIFGAGWGIANVCPAPIATQLGQGIWWSVFMLAGALLGVRFFLRRQKETEPAAERDSKVAAAPAA